MPSFARPGTDPGATFSGTAAATAFAIAVAVMLAVCARGFLHEDAYILLTYSRNLADLGQITFDGVQGPAEGGTDFLWLVAIALLHRAGIDAGIAAALLNGCGAALLARSFARVA